ECIRNPTDFLKASALHSHKHLRRSGKPRYGIGQVRIRAFDAGDECPNSRQDSLKVYVVNLPEQAFRLAAFENTNFSPGLQHAQDLAQPGVVVGQITKSKSGSHEVEAVIRKWKLQGVRLNPGDGRVRSGFPPSQLQHGVRKVCTRYLS